jgi:2-keto-4-pentenoate hydratase
MTLKEAGQQMREARQAGASTAELDHLLEIVEADEAGDVQKVKTLVKAGEKKERWL